MMESLSGATTTILKDGAKENGYPSMLVCVSSTRYSTTVRMVVASFNHTLMIQRNGAKLIFPLQKLLDLRFIC
jgi:hypothetical protein